MADQDGKTPENGQPPRRFDPDREGPGRPTKKTEEMVRVITNCLQLGLNYRTAAMAAGVDERTIRAWRAEDEEFSSACKKAKAMGMQSAAAVLAKHMAATDKDGNPAGRSLTAAIFWLKTRTEEFIEQKPQLPAAGRSVEEFAARVIDVTTSMDRCTFGGMDSDEDVEATDGDGAEPGPNGQHHGNGSTTDAGGADS